MLYPPMNFLWHPMSEAPKARQRVLLLTTFGVSPAEWTRTPYHPHKYAYQCECGWFPPEQFKAWLSIDELVATYQKPETAHGASQA